MNALENKKTTILVIDDEESMRDSCSLILTKDGFTTYSAENGRVGAQDGVGDGVIASQ